MRHEDQLKLQAYLDAELSERETRAVASWLDNDPEAQALLGELRATKSALAGNEPEVQVPESREFYWSKIERELGRLDASPVQEGLPVFAWWKPKYWLPVGALAILLLLALGSNQWLDWPGVGSFVHVAHEGESPSDEMGAMTFHSDTDNVTIIWLYDRGAEITSDIE